MWKGETQGRTERNKRWKTRANPAYSTRMRRVETWRGIKHSKRVSDTSHSGPKGLPRFPGVSCRRPLLQGAIRYISTRGRLDPGRQPPRSNCEGNPPAQDFFRWSERLYRLCGEVHPGWDSPSHRSL